MGAWSRFFLSKMHISLFSFTFDFDFQHFVTFFKFSCNLVMITQVTIAHFKWNDPYMNGHWSKPKHDDQRITVAVLYSSVPRCWLRSLQSRRNGTVWLCRSTSLSSLWRSVASKATYSGYISSLWAVHPCPKYVAFDDGFVRSQGTPGTLYGRRGRGRVCGAPSDILTPSIWHNVDIRT